MASVSKRKGSAERRGLGFMISLYDTITWFSPKIGATKIIGSLLKKSTDCSEGAESSKRAA